MAPANTRRWPRHQVKLPVRIITANDVSEITVPGLTTELSQGGMALYGGVPLQPGDLMAVEFQTSNRVRVAASVRDRSGYCFGLEFLGLLPCEETVDTGVGFAEVADQQNHLVEAEWPMVEAGAGNSGSIATPVRVVPGADDVLALFLERHEAYLQQQESEIKRLRREIQEVRQSRREIELLILRQALAQSR